MKPLALLLLLLVTSAASAQKIEQYFDYLWHKTDAATARFYSVMKKKDSVWERKDYFIHEQRLQMQGSYTDTSCKLAHGDFVFYHASGFPESKGRYVNGKREGLWLRYSPNGFMQDSTTYLHGKPIGTSLSWHSNGYMSDSAVYNSDGSGVAVSWFDNGSVAAAGRYGPDFKKTGKWQFFYRNGMVSALETYNADTITAKQYFDEKGQPLADTTSKDRVATFAGGDKAWMKFMLKQLYFPEQYKFTNADKLVVVVDATIDEEGNVTDIDVSSPLHPAFDQIAVNMMKKSPKWIPAIAHNRTVKYRVRQAVFFEQTTY